jgi:DME family drug/metabolite transporter
VSLGRSGTPLLVLAGVAWGTGGLLGSLLGRETGLSPLAVAAYRLGIGGLLILAVVACTALRRGTGRRGAPDRRRAMRRIGSFAVLAAGFQAAYFTAVALTSVGLATLVTIGSAPAVVVAAEAARGRRRPGALSTVALALAGLGLLVGGPTAVPDPATLVPGVVAAVAAGAGFATMTLLGTRPVPGLDAATSTGSAFVVGGLLLAVVAAGSGGLDVPTTAAGVGLLALFAAVPTALAYTAYFRGLSSATSPATGAVLALLEPLTAAVLAAVVLGERLGVAGTVGAAVLGVAAFRAARADRIPAGVSREVVRAPCPTDSRGPGDTVG